MNTVTTLSKLRGILGYLFYLAVVVLVTDVVVFHGWLGYGYPRFHGHDNESRFPAPYVHFTGKPNVRDHNAQGFRGPLYTESGPGDLKIAFFAGSTGYIGEPPIPETLERELEKLLGSGVFVANFSVVSSHHRQHLHGILEFLPGFKPDLVIFYGGFNETILASRYDPRPGYPFNFFYRSELGPFNKLLLEHSAIAGEVDKRFGVISGIRALRASERPMSFAWKNRIVEKYFETLALARNVTATLESARFGQSGFIAFYQPYQVPEHFRKHHAAIRARFGELEYAFDVSSAYDDLDPSPFEDSVHVTQEARNLMGRELAARVHRWLMGAGPPVDQG